VYAITTEQNIAKLFKAAFIPGLMAALFYCLAIAWSVRRRPEIAPMAPTDPSLNRFKLLASIWPVLLIAFMVVGGIYGGVFTPTEGAAFGAISMLVVGVLQRSLTGRGILDSLKQTAETTGMIFIIILGSEVFNAFLARSQFPEQAAEWVTHLGLPPYLVLISLLAAYIVLGAVMDELAMLLLTLPVFFPIVQALDFGIPGDEVAIWFGILVLIVVGIGLTAPPIGLNVFVISSIAKTVPIAQTYRGVLPFIATDIVRLGLVVAFPGLALWLVRLLN
jgi:tripartite ATP-independent transporter DctM subunit